MTNPISTFYSHNYGITDRLRFTVIQVNTNTILARDLVVQEPTVMVNLSAPSRCSFKIPQSEQYDSAAGIEWKTWGQWIIPEIEISGVRRCLGAQLVNKCDVDPQSGSLMVEGIGFLGYPKGIPWLENFSPIAVDPAEVIQRVWGHLQDHVNANLGVQVLPALTGTQMLPGYSFDGSTLNFDFFAMFIREIDFQDCGNVINNLARDIPLDMVEEVSWDGSRSTVIKTVRLGYPAIGVDQTSLSFVVGENVIAAEKADELEIEPVTDVIIRGWRPGKTFSSRLTNDDMTRVRRTIMEEDASIDSTERAAAWAKRRLTRRNIPVSFKKITIDPSHPNAPLHSFNVGDTILVEGKNYPWVGDISEKHRIVGMTFKDDSPAVELALKVEGAFNYDPITYDPNWEEQPVEDKNMLINGYFNKSTVGWKRIYGQWLRVAGFGRSSVGSIRVDCNDTNELFESHRVGVDPNTSYKFEAWVRRQEMAFQSGIDTSVDGIFIAVRGYKKGAMVIDRTRIVGLSNPEGVGGWTQLSGWITTPGLDEEDQPYVDEVSIMLCVTRVVDGVTWWDDVRIEKL